MAGQLRRSCPYYLAFSTRQCPRQWYFGVMDLGDTYLDVTYGSKPFTEYPLQLAREIVSRLDIEVGSLVLDMGCGRGEMAEAFKALGMQVVGVDQASPTIANYSFDFHKSDLEKRLELGIFSV